MNLQEAIDLVSEDEIGEVTIPLGERTARVYRPRGSTDLVRVDIREPKEEDE